MDPNRLRDRITDQFSYRGERADVWRAFDLLLDTDAFLNLGYSEWYQPHVLGSCQRRLATVVGRALAERLPSTQGVRVLDVGCGRGGPAVHLTDRFGFRVTGLDLVPYNVARARENAREQGASATFVVGDATQLPVASDSVAACTAIDALVYFPDRAAVFAEVGDALEPGGVVALSDLVVRPDASEAERRRVDAFAEAWDMPPLGTVDEYARALGDADLRLVERRDVTPHSVGRFRTWTTLFLGVVEGPLGGPVDRLLRWYGLDPPAVLRQIERAHRALPSLRHVLLVARADE
jgi:SAM-dependent methyltransferase